MLAISAAHLLALWPLPADASRHGPALDRHLLLNLVLVLALAALAHVLLLVGLWLKRAPEGAPDRPHTLRVEYLPLLALTLLLGALGLKAQRLWSETHITGADRGALQIEVTGVQFAWYFRYPGPDAKFGRTSPALVDPAAANPIGIDPADPAGADDVVVSELVLPAGREVDLTLRAQDVIHGFAVPELRVKQNAVPGLVQHLHFLAEVPGTYAVLCTQVCGLGHFRMNADVRVLPAADFEAWRHAHTGSGL